MLIIETRFIVRYAETDQMGVVHHSNYPIWFEAGRTDFIKKIGMSYSKIEESGFLLPLIELRCSYKGAAKYEDEVVLKTRIKQISPVRVVFYYEIYKSTHPEQIITIAETEHVWTNKQLKPINIKKHMPDLYQIMTNAYEQK